MMIKLLKNSWVNYKLQKERKLNMVAVKIRQSKSTSKQLKLKFTLDREGCCFDRYNGVCFETKGIDNQVGVVLH